jgi:hypothetical protein
MIRESSGSYQGKLPERTYILKINQQTSRPKAVTRDGDTLPPFSSRAALDAAATGWFFDGAAHIVWVKFRLAASNATSVRLFPL